MANPTLTTVFNRLLDVSAVFSILINCFTLTVIVKNTPKNLRSFSLFLLNLMIWNFGANLMLAVAHPYPMHPLVCFRLDGLLRFVWRTETIGHGVFGLILLIVVNVATAIFISFQFRFMAIACNRLISQIDAKWGYVYCSCLHILFSGIFIAIYQSWTIRIKRYPDVIASDKEGLFCFNPNAPEINIFLAYLFTFVFLIVLGIILFVVLSFYQMHKNKGHIGEATLKMQKLLLWNLMILSGIPISLGGLPLLIAILSVFFHDIPYGQMLCAVCILILVNYGPIMCITSLFLFSRYRKAVVVMVYKLLTREIPLKWLEAVSVAPPTQFRAATTRASISPITQNEATVQTEKKSAKKVFFVR